MEQKMKRFQELLSLLRKCAGWTAETLGEKVDVSKQMISRLETHRVDITVMQYRALRQVFDEEIARHPDETRILQDVLVVLIDYPERFSEERREAVLHDATLVAPSLVADQTSRRKTASFWDLVLAGSMGVSAILKGVGVVGATAAIILGAIAASSAKEKDETNEKDNKGEEK